MRKNNCTSPLDPKLNERTVLDMTNEEYCKQLERRVAELEKENRRAKCELKRRQENRPPVSFLFY